MKIMAVDYGDSHTGLACSDRTETLASPLGTIDEKDFNECVMKVAHAVCEYEAGMVIVGDPINMNGTRGLRSEKCSLFAQQLKEIIDVPVIMWDERSTTVTAHKMMNEVNKRGKKRREVIDAAAAAIILENYLAFRANQKKKEASQNDGAV